MFAGTLTSGIISKFYSSDSRSIELSKSKSYFGRRSKSLRTNKYFRFAANKAVASQKNIFAWFDSSQHPDVTEHDEEKAQKILALKDSGVPLNDLIEKHDLPYEEQPWGNDWWAPMGLTPASWTLAAGPEAVADPSLPEEPEEPDPDKAAMLDDAVSRIAGIIKDAENQKAGEGAKVRIWQRYKDSWRPIEKQYNPVLRTYLIHQRDMLVKKLKTALKDVKTQNGGCSRNQRA